MSGTEPRTLSADDHRAPDVEGKSPPPIGLGITTGDDQLQGEAQDAPPTPSKDSPLIAENSTHPHPADQPGPNTRSEVRSPTPPRITVDDTLASPPPPPPKESDTPFKPLAAGQSSISLENVDLTRNGTPADSPRSGRASVPPPVPRPSSASVTSIHSVLSSSTVPSPSRPNSARPI